MSESSPHSADVLNDARESWWRPDFLRLVATRLGLGEVRRALDVGCGKGHWSRALLPVLAPEATLVGVDKERAWIREAEAGSERLGLGARTSYTVATARDLPFPAGSFDLVTCQTVLMHLDDPVAALREMVRVLEPGGLLLAAEPSNEALVLATSSCDYDAPSEELVDQVRFMRCISRGLRALGRGDQTLGDRLPGLFHDVGLRDVAVCQNENCGSLVPPYDDPSQQRRIRELRKFAARPGWQWEPDETREILVAGGAAPEDCDRLLGAMLRRERARVAAIDAGVYAAAHGGLFYLVSGRKSGARPAALPG